MKRVYIVHGWGGYPKEGWLNWLKPKLEEHGFEVQMPAMPDSEYPKMHAWLGTLSETVGTPDENCYFVGHSLGCIAILRYLESLPEGQGVGGAVLVAGFTDMDITVEEDEDIQDVQSFFETELDFAALRKRCSNFIAIHSDNDPFVALRYADIFREKLGAEVVIEHEKLHFCEGEGVSELPSALEAVLRLAGE
ncbi:MAG: alpha/beta hydrolase [Patescibacteria group bacterium]